MPPPDAGHRDLYAVGDHAHEGEIFVREYVRLSVVKQRDADEAAPLDDRHVEEGGAPRLVTTPLHWRGCGGRG